MVHKTKETNYRKYPEYYRIARGEQGVFNVEPYKSELLPHWRFKNREATQASADKIHELFQEYKEADDFVGMDMARKYLQMGYTRSRRYANYPGGKKYAEDGSINERHTDEEKAGAAQIFQEKLDEVKSDPTYQERKKEHQKTYG
ncbi:uncharacterized protein DUF4385 [Salsuginibacillus halophilus]|uniref:Uncharacterized protein DUF4385 n=1 Tax=Salsuginibacillus halophilus TaxID=517424 RepID=A0A2P8H3Q7_9BACI|nr:DUF4385 domain-containing protein [Salsuginibacillus halophilus]PSL40864.1 uncharacterized protein DUF4385 [Salsuginibacillus halophilus]